MPKSRAAVSPIGPQLVSLSQNAVAVWQFVQALCTALDRSHPNHGRSRHAARVPGLPCLAVLLIAGTLVSCGGGKSGEDPTPTPPTGGHNPVPMALSITSPASGTISGSVDLTAAVTGDGEVAGVQFQVDGANFGAEDTGTPYSTTWDTTTASNGPHTLSASARDVSGKMVTSVPVNVTVTNAPLPPGAVAARRVEETDAALTLSADWVPAAPDWYGWSGGAAVQASLPPAKATYTFIGTSVTWIGQRSNVSGIARVKVDADPTGTLVDLYAHNVETNNPVYSVYGLSPGSHTLTIEPTGNQNPASGGSAVVVDAFVVPAPVVSHLQETDPAVAFTGLWAKADDRFGWSGGGLATLPDPPAGGARVSATNGATATLTFRGTAVSWTGYRGRDGGQASVTVDGGAAVLVDTYSPADKVQATVFTATRLADVSHTLTITVLGTHYVASTGAKVVVDAFDVTTPGRRFQETDPAVVYSPGEWIWPNINRTWSEGAIAESPIPGAFVTFTFTGTSVSWIGCRKLTTGSADIYLDGIFVKSVNLYLAAGTTPLAQGTEAYQTTIYRVDDLPPGLHTLKIVNTGKGSYTVIDAFDVRP